MTFSISKQNYLERLDNFYQTVIDLSQADTIEEIYYKALAGIVRNFKANRATLLLFNADGHLSFRASQGIGEDSQAAIEEFLERLSISDTQEPFWHADTATDIRVEALRTTFQTENIRSIAVFPATHQGLLVGKFAVYYDAPLQYSDSEIQLGKTLANYISVAVTRKQTEEALKQKEQQLAAIADNIPSSVYRAILHRDGTISLPYISAGCLEVCGIHPSEAINDPQVLFALIHPDDLEMLKKSFRESAEQLQPFRQEFRIITKSGQIKWIQDNAKFSRSDNGDVVADGFKVDITSRKVAEQTLKESEERYRILFNNSSDAVFVHGLTEEGNLDRFTEVNDIACQSLGYTREELLQLTPKDIVPPECKANHKVNVPQTNPWVFEIQHLTKDGRRFPVEVRINRFTIQGKTTVLGIARDISSRKAAEKALKESEERYRILFNSGADAVFVHEVTEQEPFSRFTDVNDIACQSLGYTREELLQLTPGDIIAPPHTPNVLTDRPTIFEIEHITRDGRCFPVEVRLNCFELNGKTTVLGIARDISDRKAAEKALKESEERLRATVSNVPIILWAIDLEGRFTLLEGLGLSNLGLRPGQVVGKSVFQISRDYPQSLEKIRRAFTTGEGYQATIEFSGRILESRTSVIKDSQGKIGGLIGVCNDVTDRVIAEGKLRKSEAALAEAQKVAHLGNWEIDLVTHKISWSLETFRIFGIDSGQPELELSEILQMIHPDDREKVAAGLETATQQGGIYEREYRIIRPDGTLRNIFNRGQAIFDDRGTAVKLFGIVMDITDRKQAEEASRQLEREKELNELRLRFFSMASHELRTPLSIVQAAADIIEHNSDASLNEKIHRNIHRIQSSIAHVIQLLDDILEINRAQSGKLGLNLEPLNLEAFCRQVLQEVLISSNCQQRVVVKSKVSNTLEAISPGCQILIDKNLLRSILINLLSNAIKYSPGDSKIGFDMEIVAQALESDTKKYQVIFRVCDKGIGVPVEDRSHLFEAFHRGGNVKNLPGTGLGLAVVKQYVEVLGGCIEFESEVGTGTTFTVNIPVEIDCL